MAHRNQTTQLYRTAYNKSCHVLDIRVVCCLRTIVLSYASHNPAVRGPKHFYYPRTTKLLLARDI